jgi:phosphoesterase RecJ-like protein
MQERFPENLIAPVKESVALPRKIVIVTHHRPDGDAMGSSLGLSNYLSLKGHDVSVITPSDYPDFLAWLPGNENVIIYQPGDAFIAKLLSTAEIIFCLDFNWLSRTEEMEQPIRNSPARKIVIDHHLDPEDAYDVVFSYPDACSTSELIYQFILALGDEKLINKQIAECLYCGIMTDTNSFRYSSMKSYTHRIIANLMEAGAENFRIHERVYDQSTESRLRLLGYALQQKLTVLPEYRTAYIALSEAELEKFHFRTGDTEGLVNYALSINNIVLAVFFSERDGEIKISFRSKGNFSVKELSSKYFSGGGHKNASGGKSDLSLEETVVKFISILPEYKEGLLSE